MMNNETKEKIEAMAAEFGLPVWWLNFAGGWLLGCQPCTTAGHIVKLYAKGKITKEQHKQLFLAVANAKAERDKKRLDELKGVLKTIVLVMLAWTHPQSFELSTIIEKTISGNCTSGFAEVARTGVGITLWPDDLARPGDCYRVKVFNDQATAPYSNTAQVPTLGKPPRPCKGKKCQ